MRVEASARRALTVTVITAMKAHLRGLSYRIRG